MLNQKDLENIELAKNGTFKVCVFGAGYIGTQCGFALLKKRNIKPDFFCDNGSAMWGKEIRDGILCISPNELEKRKEDIICFLMVGALYCDEVYKQLEMMGIKRIVQYNDLFEAEEENYFPFMKRKIAVYTCIVGGYDDLLDPISISPDCEYYIISDKKPEKESTFKYIDIHDIVPSSIADNTRKNRYCKINAHKVFPKHKYSIYFDGNIQLRASITELLKELPKTRLTVFCPNRWKSVYREMMSVLQNGRDEKEVVLSQAERYWLEGMPEDFGSVMCGILLREHNNPICKKLMQEWWEQLEMFSKRDQISLPYILWKNGYSISDVGVVVNEYCFWEGPYWKFCAEHNQPRVNQEKSVMI